MEPGLRTAAASIQLNSWLASVPPPVASNAMVASVAASASVSSSSKCSLLELQTYFAPNDFNRSTCSCFLTTLTSSTPSLRQIFTSICPRFDAAAVCTSLRMVSTMPSAVSGLTKHEAPSAAVVPSCKTRHWLAGTARYCEYMAPPITATILPSNA